MIVFCYTRSGRANGSMALLDLLSFVMEPPYTVDGGSITR